MLRPVIRLTLLALLITACDDSSKGKGAGTEADATATPDAQTGGPSDAGPARPDATEAPADVGPAPVRPEYIELTLAPRRALYTREEHPRATVIVYDRAGNVIPGLAPRLDVQPAGQAQLDAEGTLTFLQEGAGAVRACLRSDLCGRASFFVDDGAPALEITAPLRGTLLTGEPTVTVEGRTDPGGAVAVFVNDRPAEVAEDGTFTYPLDLVFGMNRIDVIADDGVRRPPARVVMEVVWAPAVIAPSAAAVDIADALQVRLDQRLLDRRESLPAPDEAGVQTLTDLAQIIEAFLSRAEPYGLVPNPQISDDNTLHLRVEGVEIGTPDATINVTERGFEVFLRLTDLAIETSGELMLEGVPVGMDGRIFVTAAAFAEIAVEPGPDGAPGLRVVDVGVALEGLYGTMADETAQAVLDTFGSLVRTILQRFATDLVDQLISENVPDFIELGLGDALAPLLDVPLDVPLGDGLPTIALNVGFRLSDPMVRARDALWLSMSGNVRQRGPVEPPHADFGVPVEGVEATPPWPAQAGLAVAVRLAVINALLHEIWRQGALRLDLAGVLPPEVAGLISESTADARVPPMVVPGAPGGRYLFELQIGEFDLYAKGPQGDAPDRFVLSLRAGLVLEIGEGGLHFDIAEEPDVRVQLLEQAGPRPVVPAELIERIIPAIAWPRLREQIGNGLNLAIDPIVVGADAFSALAPSIQEIAVRPTFPTDPVVRQGWFVLGAGFEVQLR